MAQVNDGVIDEFNILFHFPQLLLRMITLSEYAPSKKEKRGLKDLDKHQQEEIQHKAEAEEIKKKHKEIITEV